MFIPTMPATQRNQNFEFISLQINTFNKIGINLNTLNRKEFIKNYVKFFFFVICIIYVELALLNVIVNCDLANIVDAAAALGFSNECCLVFIQVTILIVKSERFLKLICDINILLDKANIEEKKIWLSKNSRGQFIAKIYVHICENAVIFSAVLPLILMAFDWMRGKDFRGILPYGGKFPYENAGIHVFIFNYILSLIFMYGLLYMILGSVSLFIWYVNAITGHFAVTRHKLTRAGSLLRNKECSNFTQEIAAIVTYHNRTLGFVQDLNAIYREILWVQVMLSSSEICLATYTLNNDNNIFNMPFNAMILISAFIQMSLYCFGGEQIKNESYLLSLDFYLSFPWHNMSPKEKKLLLLPLLRSQKTSLLRAIFFEIDRSLLVYIIKTAFSLNTLLSSLNE